jgi:rod shape-determining protein MreD
MSTLSGERRGLTGGHAGLAVVSLAISVVFDLMSFGSYDLMRPDLALLVLLYWSTRTHSPANVGVGWAIGLLRDIVTLTPLGFNAGLYCLTGWIGMGLRKRLYALPVPGELLLVLLTLLTGSLLAWGVGLLVGGRPLAETHLVTPLIGALCWPVVKFSLDTLAGRRITGSDED